MATTNRRRERRRNNERGTAIAELALLVGVICLIAVGVFEFGRVFHTYLSVVNGAREGARAAMDGNKTDSQLQSIASTAASPVSVTVAVSHSGAQTTVSVSSSFTSSIPFVSSVWGGGSLVMTRAFTSE
jgi:Flp pilus assembly protein TadG